MEGNRFYRNQGAAVQIETGASFGTWSEGMGVEDLVVRDNTFDTCDVNDWGKAVVYVSAFLPAGIPITQHGSPNPTSTLGDSGSLYRTAYPIFRDLVFENNRFVDYPRRAMIVSSARDVTVRGNTFSNPTPRAHEQSRAGLRLGGAVQPGDLPGQRLAAVAVPGRPHGGVGSFDRDRGHDDRLTPGPASAGKRRV